MWDKKGMWFNPLPSEAVIGAIIGAVLSTIMAYYKYFEISNVYEIFIPLFFVFMMLSYGVCLHFYCALSQLERSFQSRLFLGNCLIMLIVFLLLKPKEFDVKGILDFSFIPSEGSMLMDGVLIIWLILLRGLTFAKKKFEMGGL